MPAGRRRKAKNADHRAPSGVGLPVAPEPRPPGVLGHGIGVALRRNPAFAGLGVRTPVADLGPKQMIQTKNIHEEDGSDQEQRSRS